MHEHVHAHNKTVSQIQIMSRSPFTATKTDTTYCVQIGGENAHVPYNIYIIHPLTGLVNITYHVKHNVHVQTSLHVQITLQNSCIESYQTNSEKWYTCKGEFLAVVDSCWVKNIIVGRIPRNALNFRPKVLVHFLL